MASACSKRKDLLFPVIYGASSLEHNISTDGNCSFISLKPLSDKAAPAKQISGTEALDKFLEKKGKPEQGKLGQPKGPKAPSK